LLHTLGATSGLYLTYGWFQNLTHAASASALAGLVAVIGITFSYRQGTLLAFVIGATAAGAIGWEVVEYFGLLDAYGVWLHFHSVQDMLVDMSANAVGVTAALIVLYVRGAFDLPHDGVSVGQTDRRLQSE
jgi:hypothetical protein